MFGAYSSARVVSVQVPATDATTQAQAPAEAAREAEARSGTTVRVLDTVQEISLAFDLFNEVWGSDGAGAVPLNVMKALAHSRNYLAGAFGGDRMVGASLAFAWGDLAARSLHSHITGVLEGSRGRGIGHSLKLHQRAWAAERGYDTITWTFDPLVQRNGWFNLIKLRARIEEYEPDFYGPMDDGMNAGDATDRCLAVWDVEPSPCPDGEGEDRPPAVTLLSCGPGQVPVLEDAPADAPVLACQVPRDIVELRRSDPALALRWRRALRDTMGAAIDAGFVAFSMTRDGYYLLERNNR